MDGPMAVGEGPPETDRELGRLALSLAEGAADVVRAGAERAYEVSVKSSRTDLVTEVDRRTEAWLAAEVARRRPDDGLLGEEGASKDGESDVRWLLDPIDGTMNFVLGLPQFAVSVAAERDGVVVAGAVVNPATRESFHAVRRGGAFLGDTPLTGPRDITLDRAIVATGFTYDPDVRVRQANAVAPLIARIGDLRRLGSAALDLCFVAAGRLDGYFESSLNPWDCAAGALIAVEAGCWVSIAEPDGSVAASRRGREFVVACGRPLADEFTALLRETGAG